jgi:hypothetical protein
MSRRKLSTALDRLAGMFENGALEAAAHPARFVDYVCDHIADLERQLADLRAALDPSAGAFLDRLELANKRIHAVEADNERLRGVLGRVIDWTHQYGAALCPGTRPDTFGEGMREAKEQIKRLAALAAPAPKEKDNV